MLPVLRDTSQRVIVESTGPVHARSTDWCLPVAARPEGAAGTGDVAVGVAVTSALAVPSPSALTERTWKV